MDAQLQTKGYSKLNDWTWQKLTPKFKIQVILSGRQFNQSQYWINATNATGKQLVGVYPVAESSLLNYLTVVEQESASETSG